MIYLKIWNLLIKLKDIQNRNKNKSENKINDEIKNYFDNRIIIIDCHELRKKHDDENEGELILLKFYQH